jgi:serine/threonine-protein kinase
MKCLEKDPGRRYSSASAVADELDRYLRSEPIEARPAGFGERLRRWIRRETGFAARLAIMGLAVAIVEVSYLEQAGDYPHRPGIRLSFAVWAVLAFVFQWLLRRERTASLARYAWAISDPVLLLIVLLQAPPYIGTILVGYPVLIIASGLWFKVRLVTVSTVASVLSYTALIFLRDYFADWHKLLIRNELGTPWHYPLIFIAALTVIGLMVGFQVHRVRTLSRYFDQLHPPDA